MAAEAIFASGRGFTDFPTALGYALGYAAVHLRGVPERCARHIIDVAGDGINNEGFAPAAAYRAFGFEAITVNGLVIAGEKPDPVTYYRNEVIRGPGAFVEVADGFEDYAAAMKRKLLREIGTGHYARLGPEEMRDHGLE
jgi:Ca-activated chloride channel family protein